MSMLSENETKSKGKIQKWLLILGGIIVLIIVIAILGGGGEEKEKVITPTPERPITEVISDDIEYKLIEAKELGSILKGSESRYPEWQKDLTTEGKFIWVEISEKNVGKRDTYGIYPDIIDNQGRQFSRKAEATDWIAEEKAFCGFKDLKPGFSPINCVIIYEVAKDSTGFKVKIGTFSPKYLDTGL